jgi:hypothetical protein
MHRFKLAQIKTPGSVGSEPFESKVLHRLYSKKNIIIEFSRTRNGNVIVVGKKYPYDV